MLPGMHLRLDSWCALIYSGTHMSVERRPVLGALDELLSTLAKSDGPIYPAGAEKVLFDIWYLFARAGGDANAEAKDKRRSGLEYLGKHLSPEAAVFLEELVRANDGAMVPRGLKIRDDAVKAAAEEVKRKRPSRGEAVHSRRVKANERRGTPPRLIH